MRAHICARSPCADDDNVSLVDATTAAFDDTSLAVADTERSVHINGGTTTMMTQMIHDEQDVNEQSTSHSDLTSGALFDVQTSSGSVYADDSAPTARDKRISEISQEEYHQQYGSRSSSVSSQDAPLMAAEAVTSLQFIQSYACRNGMRACPPVRTFTKRHRLQRITVSACRHVSRFNIG